RKSFSDNLQDWNGEKSQFDNFKKVIRRIIRERSQYGFSHPVDPIKPLDTAAIFHLPKVLQQTALVITTLQMGTVREIARQLDEEPSIVKGYLTILEQEGYVGVIERGSRSMYYATS
ncbi:MAG: hypothetical protein ACXAD7_23705, partial [Candidatus Kariarchaeaceae archaeon]